MGLHLCSSLRIQAVCRNCFSQSINSPSSKGTLLRWESPTSLISLSQVNREIWGRRHIHSSFLINTAGFVLISWCEWHRCSCDTILLPLVILPRSCCLSITPASSCLFLSTPPPFFLRCLVKFKFFKPFLEKVTSPQRKKRWILWPQRNESCTCTITLFDTLVKIVSL